MENVIIIGILVICIGGAVVSIIKKSKSGGGCCGGNSSVRERKELAEPKIGEKSLVIEGMHCENCRNLIERVVNKQEGVVCKVNLKKKTAVVSYSREIQDEELKKIIEDLGYEVKEIR